MSNPLRLIHRLTVIVAVVASSASAYAVELDKPAQSCQAAISKASRSLQAKYLKAFGSYLAAEMAVPGSGDAVKRDDAITTAIRKFYGAIAKKCDAAEVGSDVFHTAPPAGLGLFSGTCGQLWGGPPSAGAYETACAALPAGTTAEKSACWRCFLVGELREWLKIHYPWVQGLVPDGSDLDCGAPPVVSSPPSSDEAKCLTAVPKLANALLIGTEKITAACLDNVRKGKIPGGPGACPDEKGQTAIAKLEEKVTAGVAKACENLPLWWDECPESELACGSSPIGSLTALSACSNDAVQPIGEEITCGLYADAGEDGIACAPRVMPTPTPTATPTPTRTATLTPTPSPTSTTPPACCQFGGGVCGGGDPDSCVPSSGTVVRGGAVCDASGQCATGPMTRGGCCQYSIPVSTCAMPIDEATCEADGGVYQPDADFCSPSGSCVRTSRVFATSTTYEGDFGGFNNGVYICGQRAAAAGLGGYYMAWLSDGSFGNNPQEYYGRYRPTAAFARLDGVIVADSWSDLTDGSLDAPINVDEFGARIGYPSYVWTNTNTNGTIASTSTLQNCSNWTATSSGDYGLIGRADETSSYWTNGWGTWPCALTARLYCVEQR